MCRKNCAVFCVGCFYENVTFNVCANSVILVKICLVIIGNLDVDGNIDCLACCYFNRSESEVLEEEVCVIRCDLTVAVNVSSCCIEMRNFLAYNVVDDSLSVVSVCVAVLINIAFKTGVGNELFAVNSVCNVNVERCCVCVKICVSAIREHILCEHICGECVFGIFVREVRYGEIYCVVACSVGVVTEFSLNLTVGSCTAEVFLNENIGLCVDCVANVCKTCALVHNSVVFAAFRIDYRSCGGHEKAVDKLSLCKSGLFCEFVITDVLTEYCCHTCYLRRSHGSTGHCFVLIVICLLCVRAVVCAPYGVDASAGSCDFRLEFE